MKINHKNMHESYSFVLWIFLLGVAFVIGTKYPVIIGHLNSNVNNTITEKCNRIIEHIDISEQLEKISDLKHEHYAFDDKEYEKNMKRFKNLYKCFDIYGLEKK